nr:sushi, von Willebrand factor type A, EGF and pentraxin domain-containing protein 1-like [Crassostrea virginica]
MVENNKAQYHCNPGYFQKDNTTSTIVCNTGNAWSITDFECIQRCPPPPVIAFADVMVHNNIALYSCQNGHRPISGSSLINCSKSNWQATTFSCYASSCGEAPTIQNADVLVHDDVAMYACRYGYAATAADNNISCVSGTWLHTTFKCLSTNFFLTQSTYK